MGVEECMHYRVCHLHFEDFMLAGMLKERLKLIAIPTIFKSIISTDENITSNIQSTSEYQTSPLQQRHENVQSDEQTTVDIDGK